MGTSSREATGGGAEALAETSDIVHLSAQDILDGQDAAKQTYADVGLGETIILDGSGVGVRVNRGELLLTDGTATTRRERRISRSQAAAGQVRRVLVLGDGMVTTEAMAWCHALKITLVIGNSDGAPLLVGGPQLYRHGTLAKAQALATTTYTGMAVVQQLLDRRLADQARITRHHLRHEDRASAIDDLRPALSQTASPAEAMIVEMQAADHYWSAWRDETRLTFAPKDRARVPAHWTRFGGRSSPLGEAAMNRHAADPVNAMINYGMRLAEIETTIACQAIGLDPHIGLAHADQAHRPAFILDLMETVRGVVEETVWQLTVTRTFRKLDFAEAHTGEIRLLTPFTHQLADALLPVIREAVGPVAEQVAQQLVTSTGNTLRVPTALSRSRSKKARATRGDQARSRRAPTTPTMTLWTCPQCGGAVTGRMRVRCASCIEADPSQTAEIRGRRGRAIAARLQANRDWEDSGADGQFDPTAWAAILPGLQSVKLAEIVATTGLSKSFASRIRAGLSTPHASHWTALAELAQR